MKNLFKTSLFVVLILFALPSPSNALSIHRGSNGNVEKMDAAEAQKLITRLEEIKAMNTKSLTRKEKRELKREVNTIQHKLDSSGGVYLSVGAVILIIVLLIILL